MEFVKITFPTKEDIATGLYDSVAAAMEAIPDATPTEEQVSSLYEMGWGIVNSFAKIPMPQVSMPQIPMPQMGKIPLEEWSSSPQSQDENP